jgi:hypothetical protein
MLISYVIPLRAPSNGTRTVTLGNDALKEYISNYRPGVSVDTQVVAIPRAPWKLGFDRGNAEVQLSWEVSRSLADYVTTVTFIHSHLLELQSNRSGSLFVSQSVIGSGGGGVQYRNARFQRAQVTEINGVFVKFQYQFWCSEITPSSV